LPCPSLNFDAPFSSAARCGEFSELSERLELALGIEHYASIVKMNDAAKRFFHVVTHDDTFNRPRRIMVEADSHPLTGERALLRKLCCGDVCQRWLR
jgi:hypothetical protein